MSDLFSVQAGRHEALACALVQVVNLFLGLGKSKAYLLFGQIGSVEVQRVHNAGNKSVCCSAAGLGRGADLPLQSLLVRIRVDVWLLEKAQRHAAVVQCFVQVAAFLGVSAHAGDTVKHDGVPRLYGAQQLIQRHAALAGCAGIDLSHDMCRGVCGGNVAHLAFNILLRRRNTAIPVH